MEETSNIKQNNQYNLSIRFGSDGFSLWINDSSGYLISSKTISSPIFSLSKNNIVKIIEQEAEGLLKYRNIRLICDSDTYTFVPSALYEHGNESDFLLLSNQIDKKECIISNEILTFDTVNVFSLPINLKEALNHLFESVKIEQHLSYFITDKVPQRNETGVHIWVRSKIMDVVVIVNGNLHLINSYIYSTPEDFTYFTLNIFEQLSLDTNLSKVNIYNSEGNNELQKTVQKYVKYVEVVS